MTNHQLVRKYEKLRKQSYKLVDWFCSNNMGHLRPSDLRTIKEPCAKVIKYLKILDELSELRIEAKLRYGPGLINIRRLLS